LLSTGWFQEWIRP